MHLLFEKTIKNVSKVVKKADDKSYCCSRFWLYGAINEN